MESISPQRIFTCLSPFLVLVTILIFVFHWGIIWVTAVDIPYFDEWDNFPPGSSIASLWPWVIETHNEHRIVMTRFLTWASYHVNGWNLWTMQQVNFFLYCTLAIGIALLFRASAPAAKGGTIAAFVLFLGAPIAWENHMWGFQSQVHLMLLFLLGSAWGLFHPSERLRWRVGGAVCAALSIGSFSGSVPGVILLSLSDMVRQASLVKKGAQNRGAAIRKSPWLRILSFLLVHALMLTPAVLFLISHQRSPHHPPTISPLSGAFWEHFLMLISLGFGFASRGNFLFLNAGFGLLGLAFVLGGVFREWKSTGSSTDTARWRVHIFTLMILAILATISMARAGFGAGQAKTSRYAEFSMLLIPLAAMIWHRALQSHSLHRGRTLFFFWIFCLLSFYDDWSFNRYFEISQSRKEAQLCVAQHYLGHGNGRCPSVYPFDLGARLQKAENLNLSFFQRIRFLSHNSSLDSDRNLNPPGLPKKNQ